MIPVSVSMLPQLAEPAEWAGGTAVMIDVLRASTTIAHALAHGAQRVVPCLTVEVARETANRFPRGSVLLGGERNGRLIAGFDLDNSPLNYTPQTVSGKTIVFTTTNGTKALQACSGAAEVFIGAFVNRSAIVQALQWRNRPVHLACAGTDGQPTAEDILFAGDVAHALITQDGFELNGVQAQMAVDFYRHRSLSEGHFREAIDASRGAQNLTRLGLTADIDRAMAIDFLNALPAWDENVNEISLSESM